MKYIFDVLSKGGAQREAEDCIKAEFNNISIYINIVWLLVFGPHLAFDNFEI